MPVPSWVHIVRVTRFGLVRISSTGFEPIASTIPPHARTPHRIRTDTEPGLNRMPLPFGLLVHVLCFICYKLQLEQM